MPYYRRNVYVLSTTVFLASLCWNLVMPFLVFFMRDLGASGADLPYWTGLAFAAHPLAGMLMQPLWGKIGDASGRKRMILRAGFCLSGVYFGMSLCQTPLQLVIMRFLNGALTGFIPSSYALIATNTPQQYAPRSLATAQAMGQVGLIAGPALGGLAAAAFGYRGTMQISGAAILLAVLLVWWLVEEKNKPTDPDDTSLLQDFKTGVKSPMQLSLMLVTFLTWTISLAAGPYLALHLKSLASGGPDWLLGIMYSLPAAAFVATAHLWAEAGERIGHHKTIFAGMLAGGVLMLALPFTRSIWLFGALYFAAGAWVAALSPSSAALTSARITEAFRGRAYALQLSAGTLGGLIAPLVGARLIAAYGTPAMFANVAVIQCRPSPGTVTRAVRANGIHACGPAPVSNRIRTAPGASTSRSTVWVAKRATPPAGLIQPLGGVAAMMKLTDFSVSTLPAASVDWNVTVLLPSPETVNGTVYSRHVPASMRYRVVTGESSVTPRAMITGVPLTPDGGTPLAVVTGAVRSMCTALDSSMR